ncbi:class I SAM-dependent methyltransferase [Sorangium sp. So ce1097]|uniref:class I SAM-dependent methyltransferase n=1 Tax=Sorangium sp. So ce1097 TaxID=3133330 RepID=UPI003F5F4239
MSSHARDHVAINLANWNSRVPVHEQGYELHRFREDPRHLSEVVEFDRARLGDVRGLDVVHLQCHIGTDTLSLARLGARATGLDFSEPALAVARRLAADCGAEIAYVCSDVHDAAAALGAGRFDVVYTGIGALCWLDDIQRWAATVAALLKPGGRLFLREGHPMLWSLADPRPDGLLVVEYPYFKVEGGTLFHEEQTYVSHEGKLASPESISFNHGLGEIISALFAANMRLTDFTEHDSVPWNPLGDAMVKDERGEWRLRERPERLAASYTLKAVKG